jgi:hypothetical protein
MVKLREMEVFSFRMVENIVDILKRVYLKEREFLLGMRK